MIEVFVYFCSAMRQEIIPPTLEDTLLLYCLRVMAIIVITLKEWMGQSLGFPLANCVLTLPSTFFSKTTGALILAFLHTSYLIFSCIQKQGKVCHCLGSVKYRGSFFDSQKTFKMGKTENGEQYCSATTQHHNTTIS